MPLATPTSWAMSSTRAPRYPCSAKWRIAASTVRSRRLGGRRRVGASPRSWRRRYRDGCGRSGTTTRTRVTSGSPPAEAFGLRQPLGPCVAPSDPRARGDASAPDRRRFPPALAAVRSRLRRHRASVRRCRRPLPRGAVPSLAAPPRALGRRTPGSVLASRPPRLRVAGSGLAACPGAEGSSRPYDLAASRLILPPERPLPLPADLAALRPVRAPLHSGVAASLPGPALRPVSPSRSLGPLGAMRNVSAAPGRSTDVPAGQCRISAGQGRGRKCDKSRGRMRGVVALSGEHDDSSSP